MLIIIIISVLYVEILEKNTKMLQKFWQVHATYIFIHQALWSKNDLSHFDGIYPSLVMLNFLLAFKTVCKSAWQQITRKRVKGKKRIP